MTRCERAFTTSWNVRAADRLPGPLSVTRTVIGFALARVVADGPCENAADRIDLAPGGRARIEAEEERLQRPIGIACRRGERREITSFTVRSASGASVGGWFFSVHRDSERLRC